MSNHSDNCSHVALVVAQARDGDLRDHDLLRVAPRAHHARRLVQARARGLALVHAVEDGRVVLDGCDVVRHVLALLAIVGEACDPLPAAHVGGVITARDACGLQAHSTARRCL